MQTNMIEEEREVIWGFLGTFLWGIVILLVILLGETISLLFYMLFENIAFTEESISLFISTIETDSFLLFISSIGGMVFVLPLIIGIVKLKEGSILKDYLSLNGFTWRILGTWIVVFIFLYIGEGLLLEVLGAKEIPDFMLNLEYPTLMMKISLLIAVVIIAPIIEEVIFRGFLLKGFAKTFMGTYGAIILTSAIWAVIHLQYETVYVFAIFLVGLVFGYARVVTNSLYIPMIMHALMNLWSILGLFYVKGVFG